MAGTHTVGEAIEIVRKRPDLRAPDDSAWSLTAANAALTLMWNAYSWDESIRDFPPFYLTPGEAYQTAPFIEIPPEFSQIHSADLVTLHGDRRELSVRKRLKPSMWEGDPDQIAWIPEKAGFIVTPTPSEAYASPESQVVMTYKAKPPQVKSSNLNSGLLPFEDRHYHVFLDALAWAYAKFSGSQAAGGSVWQDGRVARTGLLANFYDSLQESTLYEEQGRGYGEIAPSESLMHVWSY